MYSASHCPFCSSSRYKPYTQATDVNNIAYDYNVCESCGTVFLGEQLSDADFSRIYEGSYYGDSAGRKFLNPVQKVIDWFRSQRAKHVWRDILNSSSSATELRCLDIGCGDGVFLAQMKKLGFDIYGTEIPGPAAVRAKAVQGVKLHLGSLDEAEYEEGFFDAVTMWHVIEHLPQVAELPQKISRILKPGGKLYISCPNIESWQARAFSKRWLHLDPPRHLWLTPPERLISMFELNSFELVSARHFSAEQNVYGILQSLLNLVPQRRDYLYEVLKGNQNSRDSGSTQLLLNIAGALCFLPLSIVFAVVESIFHRGGTIELSFSIKNKR